MSESELVLFRTNSQLAFFWRDTPMEFGPIKKATVQVDKPLLSFR